MCSFQLLFTFLPLSNPAHVSVFPLHINLETEEEDGRAQIDLFYSEKGLW